MKAPRVSIIILNYNGLKDTTHCLKHLLKTTYPNFKIYVVDNGSLYNEASLLFKRFKNQKIEFIRFEKNYGFTGGNNKILKTIKDKYAVLLNNDTQTPPNWLSPLVELMEKNRKVAAVQPKILWFSDKRYFDYAGACGGFIDFLGYPFTRGRIFNNIEEDKGQYDTPCEIFWASGAAMMIRTNVLKKVGYFDELFFNYMEEIDLCCRIKTAGFKIMCEPKSYIYHSVASTASKTSIKKRYWEHRNNLLFVLKNFPIKKLFYIFPIRIVLENVSFLYYLFTPSPRYSLSVLLSELSLLFYGPLVLIRRLFYSPNVPQRRVESIYKGSILFSYFILKKREYSEI